MRLGENGWCLPYSSMARGSRFPHRRWTDLRACCYYHRSYHSVRAWTAFLKALHLSYFNPPLSFQKQSSKPVRAQPAHRVWSSRHVLYLSYTHGLDSKLWWLNIRLLSWATEIKVRICQAVGGQSLSLWSTTHILLLCWITTRNNKWGTHSQLWHCFLYGICYIWQKASKMNQCADNICKINNNQLGQLVWQWSLGSRISQLLAIFCVWGLFVCLSPVHYTEVEPLEIGGCRCCRKVQSSC